MRVVVVLLCCAVWFGVCFAKTTLCVDSKRSRVYIQNASTCAVETPVCHMTHARFDDTHGGVLNVHGERLGQTVVRLSLCLSLLIFFRCGMSLSLVLALSLLDSFALLNDIHNDHSFTQLPVLKALALRARVRGLWPFSGC